MAKSGVTQVTAKLLPEFKASRRHGVTVDKTDGDKKPENYFIILKSFIKRNDCSILKDSLEIDKYHNVINFQDELEFTLLHFSTLFLRPKCTEILLEFGANPMLQNYLGETPLHSTMAKGCRCQNCVVHRRQCLTTLVELGSQVHDIDLDVENYTGETALYYCAHNMFPECAEILIKNGANIYHKTKETAVALLLAEHLPGILTKELDNYVSVDTVDTRRLKVDFGLLLQLDYPNPSPKSKDGTESDKYHAGNHAPREMSLLLAFCKSRKFRQELVDHPVIQAYLHIKWKTIRNLFYLLRLLYLLILLLYTATILKLYINTDCNSELEKKGKDFCWLNVPTEYLASTLLGAVFVMLILETYKICYDAKYFAEGRTGCLWWILCFTWIVTLMPAFKFYHGEIPRFVAAGGIIYSWLMMLAPLSRIPWFAIHIGLLFKVVRDFSVLLLTYSIVLVAFSLGFLILFQDNPMFASSSAAFFKVCTMMKGTIDYKGVFDESHTPELHQDGNFYFASHATYLVFIFFVGMVLTSLMIGLAVKDTEDKIKESKLGRLSRLIHEIGRFEIWMDNRFLTLGLSRFFRKWFSVNSRPEVSRYSIMFSPINPHDRTLREDLKALFVPYLRKGHCNHLEILHRRNIP